MKDLDNTINHLVFFGVGEHIIVYIVFKYMDHCPEFTICWVLIQVSRNLKMLKSCEIIQSKGPQ